MPTVLVVDDDASVQELLRRILERAGYEVITANDSHDALATVRERHPAVVFVDLNMPGANGLWLADQVREQFPEVATVLATGDVTIPPTESLRPGIVAYLVKPFRSAEVLGAAEQGIRWSAGLRGNLHRKMTGGVSRTTQVFRPALAEWSSSVQTMFKGVN